MSSQRNSFFCRALQATDIHNNSNKVIKTRQQRQLTSKKSVNNALQHVKIRYCVDTMLNRIVIFISHVERTRHVWKVSPSRTLKYLRDNDITQITAYIYPGLHFINKKSIILLIYSYGAQNEAVIETNQRGWDRKRLILCQKYSFMLSQYSKPEDKAKWVLDQPQFLSEICILNKETRSLYRVLYTDKKKHKIW